MGFSMPESGHYQTLRVLLSDRPIAFHPMLARLFGGINEALLFQQLAYWSDKGADPEWIYKTQKDIEEETTLTRTQQESARAKLRKLGVVEEQKRGLPAKLYFRIHWETVFPLLDDQARRKSATKDAENPQPSMREIGEQVRGIGTDQSASIPQSLTKSTNREYDKEDDSNDSNPIPLFVLREETERIAWVMRDISRELNDQAPLKSTTSRVCSLYATSGLELPEFLDLIQAARLRTQRYSTSIKAEGSPNAAGWSQKNKVPYFLAVLSDLMPEIRTTESG
jgi:hypothetical protein